MPRGPFNTTCDLVWGPSTATPGVVRASGACRFVPEIYMVPLLYPFELRVAWVTLNFTVPFPPFPSATFPNITFDYGLADRIAVPSGASADYTILLVEQIDAIYQPTYYRCHVALNWF